MATRTFVCDVDYTDRFQAGTQKGGNGWERHLFIGFVSPYFYRSYVHFVHDWAGVGQIVQAQLHVATVQAATHGSNGSGPAIIVKRLGFMPTEVVDGENVWTSPNKHPTQINSPYVSGVVQPADLAHSYIDITNLMELMAPATVKRRDGKPGGAQTNFGLYLASTNEADHAKSVKVFGRSSVNSAASRISIVLTYVPGPSAPSAPKDLHPFGSVQSADNFTGTFVDINSGDTLTQTQIKLFSAGGATVLWDKTFVATSAERDAGVFSVPIPALVRSGITYEWNARTLDQTGRWGPFLPTNASFVLKNATPTCSLTTPSGSYASLAGVKFAGSFSDLDPTDRLSSLRLQVRVSTAPGHPDWETDSNKWDTGDMPPTALERDSGQFARPYGGVPLSAGTYSWRARVADRWGAQSDWAYGSFILTADWTPDPGAIDFLTGYNQTRSPTRVVIRGLDPSVGGGRGPINPPLATIEDAANIGGSQYLNAPGEFYMTLPANHPQIGVIEPYQVHYAVEVWNGDRYREVFAGVITDFDGTADDMIFYGTDYLGMLNKTVDERYDTAHAELPPPTGSKYVNVNITAIIADQLAMAKAKTYSWVKFIAIGVLDAFVEQTTIWSSYTHTFDFIAGLMESHRQGTGKRSRFWVRKTPAGGYEFLLKDAPGKDRNNLRLEYGGLVQGFRITGFGDFSTHMHGFGKAREGVTVFYATAAATGVDPNVYGRVDDVRAYESVTDLNDLKRRLQQEAARAARIGKRIALGLRVDSLLPFDGFDIADSIPINIVRGAVNTNLYGSGYYDIVGVEYRIATDGHSETTLVVLPREDDVPANPDLIPSDEVLAGGEWEVGYAPPVQGDNTSKLYLDLSTGKVYQKNPDGTYSEVGTPPLPVEPGGLTMTTSMSYDATGDPVIKLTVTLVQPTGTTNRGSWVEVTSLDDGTGNPIWDDTAILLFIPAGENSTSIEGVAGNTLYFARAWSVDFVGVPSTKTASEQQVTIKDEVAPNVPSNFVAVGSIKAILASWTPSSAQDLAAYEFRYAPDDGSGTGVGATPDWIVQRARTTFMYVGDLLAESRYWCQVRAVDRSGNVDDNGTTRDYLDFPDVGYSALVSVDTTLVNADLIAIGAVQPQHIAYLTADMIQSGILHINTSQTSMFDGIKVYADDGVTEIGRWDDTGLYIRSASDPDSYIQLTDAGITIYFDGAPMTAIDKTGLNASAITWGAMPGQVNLIRNSSFEMGGFSVATINNTVWTALADWNATRVGSDTNVTTNANDLQETAATF